MLLPLQPLSHATDEVDFSSVRTALGYYAGAGRISGPSSFGGVASGAELVAGFWFSRALCLLLLSTVPEQVYQQRIMRRRQRKGGRGRRWLVVGSWVRSRGDVQRFLAVSDYSRERKGPQQGVRSTSLKRMVCTNERRVSLRRVSCGMSKEKRARVRVCVR